MESVIKITVSIIGFSFIWYQIFKASDNLKRIADALEHGKNMDVTINKITIKDKEAAQGSGQNCSATPAQQTLCGASLNAEDGTAQS